jgi:hypothetical protein
LYPSPKYLRLVKGIATSPSRSAIFATQWLV